MPDSILRLEPRLEISRQGRNMRTHRVLSSLVVPWLTMLNWLATTPIPMVSRTETLAWRAPRKETTRLSDISVLSPDLGKLDRQLLQFDHDMYKKSIRKSDMGKLRKCVERRSYKYQLLFEIAPVSSQSQVQGSSNLIAELVHPLDPPRNRIGNSETPRIMLDCRS